MTGQYHRLHQASASELRNAIHARARVSPLLPNNALPVKETKDLKAFFVSPSFSISVLKSKPVAAFTSFIKLKGASIVSSTISIPKNAIRTKKMQNAKIWDGVMAVRFSSGKSLES